MSAGTEAPARPLRVLVVDDSAVVRQGMLQLLSGQAGVEVAVAADPLIAMERMRKVEPDVILLDLEMPRMDGLSFLRHLRRVNPIPVVICSGYAAAGTQRALEALEAGAVEVVGKPRLGVRGFLEESALLLLDALRAAAQTRRRAPTHPGAALPPPAPVVSPPRPAGGAWARQVIAIGASTGGPEALRLLLSALPPDLPGIVVAQHMPEGFTAAFARSLDTVSRLSVKEAAHGDRVQRGHVLIAPGNHHLHLRRGPSGLHVELSQGPLVSRHRPSVDVLFESVAASVGAGAVGALLTGMGDDGARGLLAMRQAGSATLAQDEASSVVWGMPRVAIERGAAQSVVGLAELPAALLRACSARATAVG